MQSQIDVAEQMLLEKAGCDEVMKLASDCSSVHSKITNQLCGLEKTVKDKVSTSILDGVEARVAAIDHSVNDKLGPEHLQQPKDQLSGIQVNLKVTEQDLVKHL